MLLQRQFDRLAGAGREQAGLAELYGGAALGAAHARRLTFANAVHELLDHAAVRLQADRRFRLLEVVKAFRSIHPLPLAVLAQVEKLEVFKVEDAVAADDLKANLAAGQARRWKLGRDPQMAHD